jgi:hypothetical protein
MLGTAGRYQIYRGPGIYWRYIHGYTQRTGGYFYRYINEYTGDIFIDISTRQVGIFIDIIPHILNLVQNSVEKSLNSIETECHDLHSKCW